MLLIIAAIVFLVLPTLVVDTVFTMSNSSFTVAKTLNHLSNYSLSS